MALLPTRKLLRGERRRIALLIPAHNEATIIADTIAGIKPQLRSWDRLVVVADNCTDDTAMIANAAGAEVVERTDDSKLGKGFALDAGTQFLSQHPPDVVIVLDADCEAEPDTIDELARVVDSTGCPAQALNLIRAPKGSGPEALVSVFAFLVKNWVRPRSLHRLNIPVALTGTGMAFPWNLIATASLANGEIVEDLALGISFIQKGYAPKFCERARIWSDLPSNQAAIIAQRTRWEHGYLGSMLRDAPSLMWSGIREGRIKLILVGLDMVVPPLAMLVLLSALASTMLFLCAYMTGYWGPLCLLLCTGSLAAMGIVLSWWKFASELIPAKVVFAIPGYVFRKVGIYRRFFGNRQTEWVRTKRDGEV